MAHQYPADDVERQLDKPMPRLSRL